MYVGVVLNPQARKNRGAADDRLVELRRALGRHGEVVLTRSVEELDGALADLLPRVTHLVSDGGDGALHWLINGVRDRVDDPAEWPVFVPTNGGTIDFVARKVGIRGQSQGIVESLTASAAASRPPPVVSLDSLHLTGTPDLDCVGFALAAGGVGNRFFDKYYEDPEPRPRTIFRVIARTVAGFAGKVALRRPDPDWADHLFRPTAARVTIDGEELPYTEHAGLHAGSFEVNLGGIRLFPFAAPDGALAFQAGQISPVGMIMNLPALAVGAPLRGPRLRDAVGHTMTIEALEEPLRPILDGERLRDLRSLTIALGPRVRLARVRA